MSRLVSPIPVGASAFGDTDGDTGKVVRDYLERLAKYVPAEIIAACVGVVPLVSATSAGVLRIVLLSVLFAGCAVATPFYLNLRAENGKPKRMHLMIGTVAFVLWAYCVGTGLFHAVGIYQPGVAAVALVLFSLASGAFGPTAGTK